MAVSLDVFLPDMLGWTVLNQLKRDPNTRHIPVQILTVEEERQYGLERGAFSFMNKPLMTDGLEDAFDRIKSFTAPRMRQLLVVEDDPAEQMSIKELIGAGDVEITSAVDRRRSARRRCASTGFDCVVLDLRLPDISGFDLLTEIQQDPKLRDTPIVVFTGRELTDSEERELQEEGEEHRAQGRALTGTAARRDRPVPAPGDRGPAGVEAADDREPASERRALAGPKSAGGGRRHAQHLRPQQPARTAQHEVVSANNGQDAIDLVEETDDLSLVLMDIMMPEMDGYETIRRIRENAKFRMLPIIALTAKAMKGDREKCLEAGASDYVAKPVNTDQLLSLVRVWLHR